MSVGVAAFYLISRTREMKRRSDPLHWKQALEYWVGEEDLATWGYVLPEEVTEQLPERPRIVPAPRAPEPSTDPVVPVSDPVVPVSEEGVVPVSDQEEDPSLQENSTEFSRTAARPRAQALTQTLLKDVRETWPRVCAQRLTSELEEVVQQLLEMGWTEETTQRYVLERLEEFRLRKELPSWPRAQRYLTDIRDISRRGYPIDTAQIVIDTSIPVGRRSTRRKSSRSPAFLRKLRAHGHDSNPPRSSSRRTPPGSSPPGGDAPGGGRRRACLSHAA